MISVKISSTGLGLALVRSLVHYLKGSIDIQSTPEKGTTMVISLPLSQETNPLEVKQVYGNKALQKNKR